MFKDFSFLSFFGLMTIFCPLIQAEQFDIPITYEWLNTQSPTVAQADYLPHLRRLFHTMRVRGFLECGYSFSTRYFLENSERVFSIEFLAPSVKTDHFPLLFKFRKKERKKEGRVSINFGTRNAHFQEKAASKRASHCADIKRAKVIIGGVHVLAIHAASPDAITIACKMKNGTNGKQFFLGRHHFLDSATGGHSLDQSRGERITEIA